MYHVTFRQTEFIHRFTLFNILPSSHWTPYFLVSLNCIAGIGLGAGWMTHTCSIVCFVTLVSLHHRNRAICQGGDTLMRLMAFLLLFSPAGDGWSVDAWYGGEWESVGDPWSMRLMQVQVSILYIKSVYWKLTGSRWREGTAAWFPPNCTQFRRFKLPYG